MPIRAGIRYRPSPHQRPLFQGDILDGIPVLATPPNQNRWIVLVPPQQGAVTREAALSGRRPQAFLPRSEDSVPDAWASGAELVLARASKGPVILVTQTCDIDYRKHYQVAPLKPVSAMSPDKQESLRNEGIGYWYYLPAQAPDLEESYADLTNITSVHRSYFGDARILCRMVNAERAHFQRALAHFHGSPFGFNATDKVQEAGQYGCVTCFHAGRHQIQALGPVGEVFPECEHCGPSTLWLLLNG